MLAATAWMGGVTALRCPFLIWKSALIAAGLSAPPKVRFLARFKSPLAISS